jgi:NitT/TauT family transport system substrate-binding protein
MRRAGRLWLRLPVAVLLLMAAAAPVHAQQALRIGIGHGLAFLPLYVAIDLKLFEKHGKAAGLPAQVALQRMANAAAMQDALLAGTIDIAPLGISAFLLTRDKTKGTLQEAVGLSGLTTMPLVLVSNRPEVKSLADFKPQDRIAVPVLSAPQMYFLRMQSEKTFGAEQADRLRRQVVVLPHQQAIDAMAGKRDGIAGYFASPPFSHIALNTHRFHKVLSSADTIEGKSSFLLLAATKRGLDARPKLGEATIAALNEAADVIRKEPRRAALIFLKFEPSRSLDARTLEAVLRDLKDDFGSEVHGIEAFGRFMERHKALKHAPKSWKDVVVPQLAALPGS